MSNHAQEEATVQKKQPKKSHRLFPHFFYDIFNSQK